MRAFAIAVAAVLVCAPGTAEADELIGYGQFGSGMAGLYGELGDELDATIIRSHFGGGLRIDDFSITASFVMGFFESSNFERDGRDLISLEYGPDVSYFLPFPNRRTQLYVRGGFHRMWLSGSSQVVRTCEQTGDCTAGFYTENPSYGGYTAKLSTGIHFTVPTNKGSSRNKFYMAFWFDVGVERMRVGIINDTLGGTMFSATLGLRFGGGRHGDR